jgi:hypothetical protein
MPLISRVVLVPEDRIEATERFWGGKSELVDGVADLSRQHAQEERAAGHLDMKIELIWLKTEVQRT